MSTRRPCQAALARLRDRVYRASGHLAAQGLVVGVAAQLLVNLEVQTVLALVVCVVSQQHRMVPHYAS